MEKLIKLAEEKGFHVNHIVFQRGSDPQNLTIYERKFINYFVLCELHKWLRDEHKIFVEPSFYHNDGKMYWDCEILKHMEGANFEVVNVENKVEFENYEAALELGIYHALKILK
jgi:hypothetical protein